NVNRLRDQPRNVFRACGTTEIDKPRGAPDLPPTSSLQCEAAFPDTRWTGEGDEPASAQQLEHLSQRVLAIDERRRRGGEIAAHTRGNGDGGQARGAGGG